MGLLLFYSILGNWSKKQIFIVCKFCGLQVNLKMAFTNHRVQWIYGSTSILFHFIWSKKRIEKFVVCKSTCKRHSRITVFSKCMGILLFYLKQEAEIEKFVVWKSTCKRHSRITVFSGSTLLGHVCRASRFPVFLFSFWSK